MMCPRFVRYMARPVYRVRGWLVDRMFTREPPHNTTAESVLRSVCESILDRIEMWEMRPAFERLEALVAVTEEARQHIEAVRAEYGLDSAEQSGTEQEKKR